jgi:hypothetical protein
MILQTIEAKLAHLQTLCIPGWIGASSLATFHLTLNNETVKQNCNVIVRTAVVFSASTKLLGILTVSFDTSNCSNGCHRHPVLYSTLIHYNT